MKFLQQKTVPEIASAIDSEGEMLFIRNRGILWSTKDPFPSVTLIRDDGMYDVQDGPSPKLTKVSSKLAAQFFLDWYSGDRAALATSFAVAEEKGFVRLVPRSSRLKEYISMIEIRGDALPESITVMEAGGGKTVLHIQTISTPPFSLKDSEKVLLSPPRR